MEWRWRDVGCLFAVRGLGIVVDRIGGRAGLRNAGWTMVWSRPPPL